MSRKSHPSEEFRVEVARKLRDAIDRRFSSVAEAADDLGISRQRLHKYLRGRAIPQADLFLKAMKRWGLKIRCFGSEFSHTEQPIVTGPDSEQLRLFPEPVATIPLPTTSGRYILRSDTGPRHRAVANIDTDQEPT